MKKRSTKRTLGSMFLAFEAFLIFFGTLVAFGLKFADGATVWGVGLTLSFIAILLPAILGRPGGYVTGWLLQFVLLGISIWAATVNSVGVFYIFLAIIGLSMWIWAMIAGATIDAARIAWERNNGDLSGQNGNNAEVFRIETPGSPKDKA